MHVVGTAGHVDHGKSTLVQALTGIDPDRFEEEKRRGLTIDLGFAWFTLPSGEEIGIVDVPGHERFIRNMLAGVGAIDAAIFVVAADEGFRPQSVEHLQILDFLDLSGGVVALTKSDLVTPEQLEAVTDQVWQRLRGTCLHSARIVPVSATTGDGLDSLTEALDDLLAHTAQAEDRGRPRMFVDRSFTIAGAGTVVTGTLAGGVFRSGEDVEILPSGHRARIRSLQTHTRSVHTAVPGSRVAANLVGLERRQITRGDAIVHPGTFAVTDRFAAELRTSWNNAHALTERGAFELYAGSAEIPCTIKFLEERSDAVVPVSVGGALVAGIRPDATLLVQIFCRRPVPVDPGDRFVVRDVGRRETVAGGVVLDVDAATIRRGDEHELRRLHARVGMARDELARVIVDERGIVEVSMLATTSGLARESLERAATAWHQAGDVAVTDHYILTTQRDDELRSALVRLLTEHHAAHPLDQGMPRSALRRALELDERAFDELVQVWVADGIVAAVPNALRLASHGGQLPAGERAAADAALAKLRAAGASPPGLRELGLPTELAKALERMGELVFITPDIAYAADVWGAIERKVVELISSDGPATVGQVRDRVGTSRKYAVPLLERLDTTGITRRRGDVRDLGPRGREMAGEQK